MKTPAIAIQFSITAAAGAALCAFACALALPNAASAITVYDAGAALHANITSASPVGADGSTYIDGNGGKWQYLRANDSLATTTVAFDKSVTSGAYYRGIGGNSSRSGSPFVHVNVTGAATMDGVSGGGTEVEKDELYIHPGDPNAGNHYVVVRFIVPEAGWYSAFVTAHDLNGAGNANSSAGAEVRLLANNVLQARGVVVMENWIGKPWGGGIQTKRFSFQMSVRWMAANETIDFVVGANGAHNSDATGLKAFVTKEDEGAFYDAGFAMLNNVSSSLNPFGTKDLGMWYYLYANTSGADANAPAAPSADAFAAWAPGNLTKNLSRFTSLWHYGSYDGFVYSTGTPPLIGINSTSGHEATYGIAPRELYTQQSTSSWTRWPTLRFRPTRSGIYSGSVVVRDVAFTNAADIVSDGIVAYLLVSEKVVTNAVVCAETRDDTVHFTLPPCLVVANEPIDIVLSPREGHNADSAAISAVFRRETEVYDAGPSMAALDWANAWPAHPFADALGGGATWDIGKRPLTLGSFTTMPYAFKRIVNNVDYFGFGINSTDGGLPRAMLATNGVANLYSSTDNPIFSVAPNEIWAHPNNADDKCVVVRAIAPADGIYRARAYARDLSSANDGIRFSLAVGDCVPATARVSLEMSGYPSETAFDGDHLWLKAGESVDAVVNPYLTNNNDATGLGVCYVKEGDALPSVVNVDFTAAGSGRFSSYAGRGREGWSDWTRWNALRPNGAATVEIKDIFEADGATRRNAAVVITRTSGESIATGAASSGNSLCDAYIVSAGASDTYTFTISNLAKNAPYTLYLYSAKGNATGNATFAVGGVTKGVEETWQFADDTKTLTRFQVTTDANGTVSGTFAAADANGGAFNGLTLVGDLPDYKASSFVITVR